MSHRRGWIVVAMVALLTLALGAAAAPVEAKSTRVERRIALTATDAGQAIDASGHARVRQRGSKQDLTVEVEARVARGTVLSVYAVNGGATVKAGTIRINRFGEGELELKNYDGKRLPAGVAPVVSITRIVVQDARGTVILTGTY